MSSSSSTSNVSLDTVADNFVSLVTQLMRGASAPMVEFAERHDLSFSQLKSMFVLSAAPAPIAISKIADATGASLPATGRAVDGLVKLELATRTEDQNDRRVKLIALTELGDQTMNEIYEHRVAMLRTLLEALTPEQLDAIDKAIQPLRERVASAQNPNCESQEMEESR